MALGTVVAQCIFERYVSAIEYNGYLYSFDGPNADDVLALSAGRLQWTDHNGRFARKRTVTFCAETGPAGPPVNCEKGEGIECEYMLICAKGP